MTNCKIHDVSADGGQLKVQNSDYINIHDCQFYNGVGMGGAAIDCVWVNNCDFHRNYFYNDYSGGFTKGGSFYNVFEDNVYVNPHDTGGNANYDQWGFNPGGYTCRLPPIRTATSNRSTR